MKNLLKVSYWGLLVVLFGCYNKLFAQNLVGYEYFFDSDPGIGQATFVSIPANSTINQTFTINTTGLDAGGHKLGVRFKDDAGKWSHNEFGFFYLMNPNLLTATNLVKAEYFIGDDPGVGNGSPLPITPSANINTVIPINVSSLNPGLHRVSIRVMNNLGEWSLSENGLFYVLPPINPATQLVAAEYFFDKDPGVDSANAVTITPGANVDQIININTTGLSVGLHKLYVRVKNDKNEWSLFEGGLVNINPALPTGLQLVQGELFVNTDLGVGNCRAFAISPSDTINGIYTAQVPLNAPGGLRQLSIRVKDNYGRWSLSELSVDSIDIEQALIPEIAASDTLVCQGDTVMLTSNIPGSPRQWFKDGNELTGFTQDTIYVTQSGSYQCYIENLPSPIINVTVIPALNVTIGTNAAVCAGSPLNIYPVGQLGSVATYTWITPGLDSVFTQNLNFTNSQLSDTGNYTLTLVDTFGCSKTVVSPFIQVKEQPIVTVTESNGTLIANVTGVPYAQCYLWYDCQTNAPFGICQGNQSTLTPSYSGLFKVYVTYFGCDDYSDCYDFVYTGLGKNPGVGNNLVVFPNPSRGQFSLIAPKSGSYTLEIVDVSGRMVVEQHMEFNNYGNPQTVSVSDLASGFYMLNLKSYNGELYSQRISVIE